MASEQQPAAAPHPTNPSPEMAIAFVVESSLTVASDWSRIIADYVSPILRRLYESNPSAKVCSVCLFSPHCPLLIHPSPAPLGVHHLRDRRYSAVSPLVQAFLPRQPPSHDRNERVPCLAWYRHHQLRWGSRDGRPRGPRCSDRGPSPPLPPLNLFVNSQPRPTHPTPIVAVRGLHGSRRSR